MSIRTSFNPMGTLGAEQLPPGYTSVKGLVGKGGSDLTWIDTGFDVSGAIRWVLDTEFTGGNQWHGAFPARGGRFEVDVGTERYRVRITDTQSYYSGVSAGYTRRKVDIDLLNRLVTWSDAEPQTVETVPVWESSSTAGTDILLFARAQYNGGNPPVSHASKVYRSTIFVNGELKQDLVPALDPDGRACMFDLVNKEPYYSAGTGEFLYEL